MNECKNCKNGCMTAGYGCSCQCHTPHSPSVEDKSIQCDTGDTGVGSADWKVEESREVTECKHKFSKNEDTEWWYCDICGTRWDAENPNDIFKYIYEREELARREVLRDIYAFFPAWLDDVEAPGNEPPSSPELAADQASLHFKKKIERYAKENNINLTTEE